MNDLDKSPTLCYFGSVTQPNMQKYKFTIISLIIILIAAIPLLLLSKKTSPKPISQTIQAVSPTTAPLTPQNADTTLDQEDQQIQQSLNQTDTDLNTVSQIDTSQDSTAGL